MGGSHSSFTVVGVGRRYVDVVWEEATAGITIFGCGWVLSSETREAVVVVVSDVVVVAGGKVIR